MSPTNARKAFPCFDEPGIKATWKFEVLHNNKFVARSNMPAIESKKIEFALFSNLFQFNNLFFKIF